MNKYDDLFEVKCLDSQTGKVTDISIGLNRPINQDNILLIVNDALHDSPDKGDTITIKVLKNWDTNTIKEGIKTLIENRGHWVKD